MSGTKGGSDSGKTEAERRKERLSRALRENLKRRKEQARGRKPDKPPEDAEKARNNTR
jgi:hypothetical protein